MTTTRGPDFYSINKFISDESMYTDYEASQEILIRLQAAKDAQINPKNILEEFVTPHHGTAVIQCVKKGKVNSLQILLDNKADVNAVTTSQNTALHKVADPTKSLHNKDVQNDLVVTLISAKPDVNLFNKDDQTPLMVAAKNGVDNIVQILTKVLESKDINKQNTSGMTALMFAAQSFHKKTLTHFLENKKTDLSLVDNQGKTATDILIDSMVRTSNPMILYNSFNCLKQFLLIGVDVTQHPKIENLKRLLLKNLKNADALGCYDDITAAEKRAKFVSSASSLTSTSPPASTGSSSMSFSSSTIFSGIGVSPSATSQLSASPTQSLPPAQSSASTTGFLTSSSNIPTSPADDKNSSTNVTQTIRRPGK